MIKSLLKLSLRQQDFIKCWVLLFASPLFWYNNGEFSIFLTVLIFNIFLNPAYKPKLYILQYLIINAPIRKMLFISNLLLISYISIVFTTTSLFGLLARYIFDIQSSIFFSVSFYHQYIIVVVSLLMGLSTANIVHLLNFEELNILVTYSILYNLIIGSMAGTFFILRTYAENDIFFLLISICLLTIWLLSIKFYDCLIR